MKAAKMMCAKRKKPIALKRGGNPVAKSLSDPKFKSKVVKPKKGKGSYTRKGKALSFASGGKTTTAPKTPKQVANVGATAASNRQAAIEAFKNPKTRLSSNLQMHLERFNVRNKAKNMKSGGKTKSKVNQAGNYTNPSLRKRLFNQIKAGGKGGAPNQWSARKAQMLASAYKKAGGGYRD